MSSRFSSVLGMEELRKLRHREAQRRYMARKKIAAKKLQLARQLYERQGQGREALQRRLTLSETERRNEYQRRYRERLKQNPELWRWYIKRQVEYNRRHLNKKKEDSVGRSRYLHNQHPVIMALETSLKRYFWPTKKRSSTERGRRYLARIKSDPNLYAKYCARKRRDARRRREKKKMDQEPPANNSQYCSPPHEDFAWTGKKTF
ncbi:hypothetical protein C0Q70_08954 [Pomacea canaliculata]|uniref:Uncharacterized protein n=1 Tax=Pomacea canaliculata TaxID=400727 RepID=A0A2T7P8E9_POMCA|nr:hypothetical protein C0Q70_08954 [Pomacea canaliculata]